jgi:hypothetical protein
MLPLLGYSDLPCRSHKSCYAKASSWLSVCPPQDMLISILPNKDAKYDALPETAKIDVSNGYVTFLRTFTYLGSKISNSLRDDNNIDADSLLPHMGAQRSVEKSILTLPSDPDESPPLGMRKLVPATRPPLSSQSFPSS